MWQLWEATSTNIPTKWARKNDLMGLKMAQLLNLILLVHKKSKDENVTHLPARFLVLHRLLKFSSSSLSVNGSFTDFSFNVVNQVTLGGGQGTA